MHSSPHLDRCLLTLRLREQGWCYHRPPQPYHALRKEIHQWPQGTPRSAGVARTTALQSPSKGCTHRDSGIHRVPNVPRRHPRISNQRDTQTVPHYLALPWAWDPRCYPTASGVSLYLAYIHTPYIMLYFILLYKQILCICLARFALCTKYNYKVILCITLARFT